MIKKYNQKQIEELANILKNDGVICVPTDTVYGLCTRINSEKAHNKLVEIKRRPANKLFPIMCANKEQINRIANITNTAEKIIDYFMPGAISLILDKKILLPSSINAKYKSIAVRMATSPALEELIKKSRKSNFYDKC